MTIESRKAHARSRRHRRELTTAGMVLASGFTGFLNRFLDRFALVSLGLVRAFGGDERYIGGLGLFMVGKD